MFDKNLKIANIVTIMLYDGENVPVHCSYNPSLPHYELIYTLDGESTVNFVGKQITEKTNCLRYLPKGPQPANSKYTVDRIAKGKCIDIYFDTDSDIPNEMLFLELHNNTAVRNKFIKIHKLWYAKRDGYYHKCMSLFYDILAELDIISATYLPEEKYLKIKPAIDYIENNFLSSNIDCNALSDLCGISYSYFNRLFIMKFGLSPIKYITKKKIMYACDLLLSNKYSVSEIADMTGYENVYYFSRVFKESTGMTPTEYRKKA